MCKKQTNKKQKPDSVNLNHNKEKKLAKLGEKCFWISWLCLMRQGLTMEAVNSGSRGWP